MNPQSMSWINPMDDHYMKEFGYYSSFIRQQIDRNHPSPLLILDLHENSMLLTKMMIASPHDADGLTFQSAKVTKIISEAVELLTTETEKPTLINPKWIIENKKTKQELVLDFLTSMQDLLHYFQAESNIEVDTEKTGVLYKWNLKPFSINFRAKLKDTIRILCEIAEFTSFHKMTALIMQLHVHKHIIDERNTARALQPFTSYYYERYSMGELKFRWHPRAPLLEYLRQNGQIIPTDTEHSIEEMTDHLLTYLFNLSHNGKDDCLLIAELSDVLNIPDYEIDLNNPRKLWYPILTQSITREFKNAWNDKHYNNLFKAADEMKNDYVKDKGQKGIIKNKIIYPTITNGPEKEKVTENEKETYEQEEILIKQGQTWNPVKSKHISKSQKAEHYAKKLADLPE